MVTVVPSLVPVVDATAVAALHDEGNPLQESPGNSPRFAVT
jgi:hypothetical protein